MLDRRRFFKLFAAGSAGLSVAGKLALAEDIQNWMLSPSKKIFIPAAPQIVAGSWDGRLVVVTRNNSELSWMSIKDYYMSYAK